MAHVVIPTSGEKSQEGYEFQDNLACKAKPCLKTREWVMTTFLLKYYFSLKEVFAFICAFPNKK